MTTPEQPTAQESGSHIETVNGTRKLIIAPDVPISLGITPKMARGEHTQTLAEILNTFMKTTNAPPVKPESLIGKTVFEVTEIEVRREQGSDTVWLTPIGSETGANGEKVQMPSTPCRIQDGQIFNPAGSDEVIDQLLPVVNNDPRLSELIQQ